MRTHSILLISLLMLFTLTTAYAAEETTVQSQAVAKNIKLTKEQLSAKDVKKPHRETIHPRSPSSILTIMIYIVRMSMLMTLPKWIPSAVI